MIDPLRTLELWNDLLQSQIHGGRRAPVQILEVGSLLDNASWSPSPLHAFSSSSQFASSVSRSPVGLQHAYPAQCIAKKEERKSTK